LSFCHYFRIITDVSKHPQPPIYPLPSLNSPNQPSKAKPTKLSIRA
jgi:hypothetical protein